MSLKYELGRSARLGTRAKVNAPAAIETGRTPSSSPRLVLSPVYPKPQSPIYIYIYKNRARERERDRDSQGEREGGREGGREPGMSCHRSTAIRKLQEREIDRGREIEGRGEVVIAPAAIETGLVQSRLTGRTPSKSTRLVLSLVYPKPQRSR